MWRRISLFLVVAGLTLNGVWGQSQTNSPYSIFGLGDIYTSGYIQYPEFGGAATGLVQKNEINLSNAASYRGIDSMRFVIDFGFNNNFKHLSDENTTHTSNDFNFTYYAVGFRITPWWHTSLGITPVSNRNYRIGLKGDIEGIYNETYYIGSGNLNQTYLGQSFSILPNLSVGVNVKYLFGEILETKTILFPNEPFMRNSQQGYTKHIQSFGYNTGIMYTHQLSDRRNLNFGATYSPEQKIDYKEDYLFGATTSSNLEDISNNVIQDTTDYYEGEKRHFNLPNSFSFGVSYHEQRKQTATFSVDYKLWGDTENANFTNNLAELTNSLRVSGGYSFIPKWNSASSYFKRMTYNFGAFFEKQYMNVKGENIKAFALSAGFGLPVRRANTMVNLGVELGQRGMLKNDLIRENYIKFNIKFNFREIWFFEKKYN